ncbi:MAG: hypothetical protein AAB600_02980 [Patescibacteria group bacterium]
MNDDSILGNTLGQLGGIIKQTGRQAAKIPKDIVEGVEDQVSVKTEPVTQDNKYVQSSSSSNKDTREVVQGLYAASNNNQKEDSDKQAIKGQPEFEKMMVNKTPEERKKLLQLHLETHKLTYADKLLHPTSKKPEDRPAEKVEKERKQEIQKLEQKEAQKPPPFVQRARERVERFPGTGG